MRLLTAAQEDIVRQGQGNRLSPSSRAKCRETDTEAEARNGLPLRSILHASDSATRPYGTETHVRQ